MVRAWRVRGGFGCRKMAMPAEGVKILYSLEKKTNIIVIAADNICYGC